MYNAVHVCSYIMVGAWFYCMEVCYNIMYYFLHIMHVFVCNIIDNSQTVDIL